LNFRKPHEQAGGAKGKGDIEAVGIIPAKIAPVNIKRVQQAQKRCRAAAPWSVELSAEKKERQCKQRAEHRRQHGADPAQVPGGYFCNGCRHDRNERRRHRAGRTIGNTALFINGVIGAVHNIFCQTKVKIRVKGGVQRTALIKGPGLMFAPLLHILKSDKHACSHNKDYQQRLNRQMVAPQQCGFAFNRSCNAL